jgi:NAD(P)-dependent dehydrogenase (short-subunit alcohol dehydrogenase family)
MARFGPGAVVAVTGGARGIGRATASAFVAAGAHVAIGDLDSFAENAAELGSGAVGLPLDVTDRTSFRAFLDSAESELGPLDVLVNNAGIMPSGPFLDEDDAMTDRVLDINLRGVLIGCKLAGTRFAARGRGHIVNVASLMGAFAAPDLATYGATKSAVLGFSEAFGQEVLSAGVGVTTVLPGVVRTELAAGTNYPKWADRFIAVEPADVAAAIVASVGSGRRTVALPRFLYTMARLSALAPPSFRARGNEFVRLDHEARAAYHRRISGDTS